METATQQDYYEVLGVPRHADRETIKRAYRALAREVHPDVSDDPDAERRFRELAEAYQVLSRPQARLLYDRFGYRGRGNGGFAPWFQSFRSADSRRGAEVVAEVVVDSVEASRGVERTVRFKAEADCAACGGTGAASAAAAAECRRCEGAGRLKRVRDYDFGRLLQFEECPDCGGRGRVTTEACSECRGGGRVETERRVELQVPRGVKNGQRLRLEGEADGAEVLVRVVPLDDPQVVRYAATAALVVALVLLAIFLFFA